MSQWIKFSEKIPPETDEYLTYGEVDGCPIWAVNSWFSNRGHFSCETPYDRFITHWMPLPELPEGE